MKRSNPLNRPALEDKWHEEIWSKMYDYRSAIAHGNTPQVSGTLGSEESACILISKTVKKTIRHALEEPQLLVDLQAC